MRATVLLVVTGLLCGCSGGEPAEKQESKSAPAAASSAADACTILTKAAAEKALQHPAEKLDSSGGAANLDICQFGYQGERIADMGNVSVTVNSVDLATAVKAAEAQGYKMESVAGVGDGAYYSPDIGLYVGHGGRTAIYLLGVGGLPDPRERLVALAKETASSI
ncbi:MAG: hypothetical protein ACJ8EY_07565 [Sphingomicrobium sp.]